MKSAFRFSLLLSVSFIGAMQSFAGPVNRNNVNKTEKVDKKDVKALYQQAIDMQESGNYTKSFKVFKKIAFNNPHSDLRSDAYLSAIKSAICAKNYQEAIALADSMYFLDTDLSERCDFLLLRSQAWHMCIDYIPTQYMRFLASLFRENRKRWGIERNHINVVDALLAYETALSECKDEKSRKIIEEYKRSLLSLIAAKHLTLARFYYSRGATAAAMRELNEILLKYADLPEAPDAFDLMLKCYDEFGLSTKDILVKFGQKLGRVDEKRLHNKKSCRN